MEIINWFMSMYSTHETLAVALLSLIGGVILTKVAPTIWNAFIGFFAFIGQKIGGRLSYLNIQYKYLNWVILQNQDLNLTGLISPENKPKLEQVFISLKLLDDKKSDTLANDKMLDEERKEQKSNKIQTLFKNMLDKVNKIIKKYIGKKANSNLEIYSRPKFWKVRQLFYRDGLVQTFGFLGIFFAFVLLPSYKILFGSSSQLNLFWGGIFLTLIASLSLFTTIEDKLDLRDWDEWLFNIFPLIILPCFILIYSIAKISNLFAFPTSILAGSLLGLAGAYPVNKFLLSSNDKKNDSRNIDLEISATEIGKLLSSHKTIAILGKPGAGKSTYTQFIALTLAQEKAGDRNLRKKGILKKRFGISHWYLPILLPLRRIASYIQETEENTGNLIFSAFREKILPSELREDFSDDYIKYMLKNKRIIFLFDGLDEVADEKQFQIIVNEIKGLLSNYSGNTYLVTSRHSGWRGGISSEFIEAEIDDLDDNQISYFVDTWYQAISTNRITVRKKSSKKEQAFYQQKAKEKAEKLKSTLQNVPSIRHLANNPLLLSLICFVHYNKTLPKERLSLYEDCSKLLLEQWDIEKGLPREDIPLSFLQKEIIMQEIAFAIHSGTIGTEADPKDATEDQIVPIISYALERFSLDINLADSLFHKLVERTGIILSTEKYKNTYSFSHLTFQEFYTAKYLQRNKKDLFKTISSSKFNEPGHLLGWWKEVILLYSNMQKNPTMVIKRLITVGPKNTDLLKRNYQLASQCILEGIEKPDKAIEDNLIQELFRIRSGISSNDSTIPLQVYSVLRNFLLRWASSSYYYKYILQSYLLNIQDDDAAKLLDALLETYLINDLDIKEASLLVMSELLENYSAYNFTKKISEDRYSLLESDNLYIILALAKTLKKIHGSNSQTEQDIDNITNKIVDWFLSRIIEPTILSDIIFEENLSSIMQLFALMKTYPFIKEKERIRDRTSHIFFDFFDFPINYRHSSYRFSRSFREYLCENYSLLIDLDSPKQKEEHKRQLLDILVTGSVNQQVWAMFFLAKKHGNDSTCTQAIIKKLTYPNKYVRLAAIKSLRDIQLSENNLESVKTILTNSSFNTGYLKNLFGKVKSIVLGIGPCGSTKEEKIQISGSLAKLFRDFSVLENTISKDNIVQEPEEWNELLTDSIESFDTNSIKKLLSIVNEIDDEKTESALSILSYLAKVHTRLEQETKEMVVSSILNANIPSYTSMMYLSNKDFSNVKIDIDDETIEKLLNYKTFSISNFAFDIFCHNDVIC